MAALIMGGIAAAGAVMGAVGGRRSSKAAKKAAYKQAALFEQQMAEVLRRTERQQAEQLGLTKAGAHASGVEADTGTTGRYVQEFVDRRFYRRRYDAVKTVSAFSASLRDVVDLDRVIRSLESVVHETIFPEIVS